MQLLVAKPATLAQAEMHKAVRLRVALATRAAWLLQELARLVKQAQAVPRPAARVLHLPALR
jgi:hypothetical protein